MTAHPDLFFRAEDAAAVAVFRARLREARAAAGLTLRDAGERVGRDKDFVRRLETDGRFLEVQSVLRLLGAYGATPDWFFRPFTPDEQSGVYARALREAQLRYGERPPADPAERAQLAAEQRFDVLAKWGLEFDL